MPNVMPILSQRLLAESVEIRSKLNPTYFDAIKSAGDRLVAAVAAAAAARAELVADLLPSSPKFGERLTAISAAFEKTIADVEAGHSRSFRLTEDKSAEMNSIPPGGEGWHSTIVAHLMAMTPDDRRIYLRSGDVTQEALAALAAYPMSALLVPPQTLTEAIRSFNERSNPALHDEVKNLEGYTYAVKTMLADARRIARDIVEGRADVPAPTPEPVRSLTRL